MGEDPLVTVNDVVGFRSRVGYLRVNDSVAIRCGFGQDAHVAERGGRGKELGKVEHSLESLLLIRYFPCPLTSNEAEGISESRYIGVVTICHELWPSEQLSSLSDLVNVSFLQISTLS